MRFPGQVRVWLLSVYVLLCLFVALPQLMAATTPGVSAGSYHSVGLKSEGSLVAVGLNGRGQCNVTPWGNGFVQIATGDVHTVALKASGTVVAGGSNDNGQCNVGSWAGIAQIAAGGYHTLGLRHDGSLIAVGWNGSGQCNVGSWGNNFVQVDGGGQHTVALRPDGTVKAGGSNTDGQCNVSQWSTIVQVSAGGWHTLGLKRDGTVVCVGENYSGQCNVGHWRDIVQVSAGVGHSLGLKKDGTVVAVGQNSTGQCNVSGWANIVQVSAWGHTLGLKANGTVVAVGGNQYGQCNVGAWRLGIAPPKNISLAPVINLLLSESGPSCPLIPNGNFEAGAVSWTQSATSGLAVITKNLPEGYYAYSGTWLAWTGGLPSETSSIQQQVTVPSACPLLTFYHWVSSEDEWGWDFAYVRVNGTNLLTVSLCSENKTNGWVKKMIDLRAYANRSVSLQFLSTTDSSLNSSWFIDNVAFEKIP